MSEHDHGPPAEIAQARATQFERHFQSLVLTLCAAGISAAIAIGYQTSQAMISQGQDIKAIQHQLDRMDARFADYIPRSEADIRFRSLEQREDEHSRRIDRLESLRRPPP